MTDPLFQKDGYIRTFAAKVKKSNPETGAIMLDQTAFYPGGGGQPNDTGLINVDGQPLKVTKTKKDGDAVWHWIDGTPPPEGAAVTGQVDWQRRYQLMRTHTALHILCGVIWRDYQAQVTGGNMEPLKGRLDFEFETLQQDLVKEIEENVNAEVENARPVRVESLPRAEAEAIPDLIRTKINLLPAGLTHIRTVAIRGLDLQADGGTHVSNTVEVGRIHIDGYQSKGRINKRIRISLDP